MSQCNVCKTTQTDITCYVLLFAVIPPDVEMMLIQPEPYLAGMLLEMQCSVILNDFIDTQVDVNVLWQKDGRELAKPDRIRVSPVHSVESSHYGSLLQFSVLSSSDDGIYTCTGIVVPMENINYITSSTESAALSLSVTGIVLYIIIIL